MSIAQQNAMIETMNYLRDPRVIAAERGNWFVKLDERRMQATVVVLDDDGEGSEHWIGFKYETCDLCNGRGTHTNPSIDANGYEPDEDDCDEETGESHYMSGRYDVCCSECGGKRVSPVPDPANNDERALLAKLEAKWEDERQSAAERRAERMMGA